MTWLSRPAFLLLLPLLPCPAGMTRAAEPGGMSREQMQQNTEKMQECFQNIDQSALDGLEEEGKRVEADIRRLCRAGREDEARTRAADYARKVNGSEAVRAMRKCGMMARGMMGGMPMTMEMPADKQDYMNLCDGM
jgi:hypothetical protein